jgi:hypothetical protein
MQLAFHPDCSIAFSWVQSLSAIFECNLWVQSKAASNQQHQQPKVLNKNKEFRRRIWFENQPLCSSKLSETAQLFSTDISHFYSTQ